VGVLDEDLRAAALRALTIDRAACRSFASAMTWERCARMFLDNLAVFRRSATAEDRSQALPAMRTIRSAFTTEAAGAPVRPDPATR
jgi:hypothetical protein